MEKLSGTRATFWVEGHRRPRPPFLSTSLYGLLYSPALPQTSFFSLPISWCMTQNGSYGQYDLSVWFSTASGYLLLCLSERKDFRKKRIWLAKCLSLGQSLKRIGGRINGAIPRYHREPCLGVSWRCLRRIARHPKHTQCSSLGLLHTRLPKGTRVR